MSYEIGSGRFDKEKAQDATSIIVLVGTEGLYEGSLSDVHAFASVELADLFRKGNRFSFDQFECSIKTTKREIIRASAMSKLTAEEREALGL